MTSHIESAELKYRKILENYFKGIWGSTTIYSHGIDHHIRVWHFAKELLHEISSKEIDFDPLLAEKLIIGCYLHDLGLSSEPGKRHGMISRSYCRNFRYEYDQFNLPE